MQQTLQKSYGNREKYMQYELVPFGRQFLDQAVDLFVNSYKTEQVQSPLLPDRIIREPELILKSLECLMENPGVAVLADNRLIAYMLNGYYFLFKGQNSVQVPSYCHASVPEGRDELYRLMYMNLAGGWAKSGKHVHVIGHFAHDAVLKETLFQIGFGAFLSERLRDFTPVNVENEVNVSEERDYRKLVDLHLEHYRYYPESPIFIIHGQNEDTIEPDLKQHAEQGDVFLVYYRQDTPSGYFILGDSKYGHEGFLLRDTKTALINAAYVKPDVRRQGIGETLLQSAIEWSRDNNFERLFVEHETANYYGGKFWNKHFEPYLYFSLRYIDNTIKY
ncbi:MAG: GNAT family N-acetyltransferase [Dehalococcoidales bacterium]|nr:MAG: GNAT family N-acetyltransferase [Dehalococcoidales bacterium]